MWIDEYEEEIVEKLKFIPSLSHCGLDYQAILSTDAYPYNPRVVVLTGNHAHTVFIVDARSNDLGVIVL